MPTARFALLLALWGGTAFGQTDDELKTIDSFFEKGVPLFRAKKFDDAIPYYERAVAVIEEQFANDPVGPAKVRHELATMYLAKRRGGDAIAQWQKARAWVRRLDRDHVFLAEVEEMLGKAIQGTPKCETALPHYENAVRIRRARLPEGHPLTARALHNLASLHQQVARYGDAESTYRQAIRIAEVGGEAPDLVALSRSNLAGLYLAQARYADAEAELRIALAETVGKEGMEPIRANCLLALGGMFYETAAYRKAEPPIRAALKLFRDLDDRDGVATAQNNLGNLFKAMGRFEEAESAFAESLDIRRKDLPGHPMLAVTLHNLAHFWMNRDRFDKAEPLITEALAIREEVLPPDHPDLAISVSLMATLQLHKKEPAKARASLERAVAIYRKAGSPAGEAQSLGWLAFVAGHQGNDAEAMRLTREAIAVGEKTHGPDHVIQVPSYQQAAMYAIGSRDWATAAGYHDRAIRVMRDYAVGSLPALPEREQLLFMTEQFRPAMKAALSLGWFRAGDPDLAAKSAEWLANGKGLTQEVLVERERTARAAVEPADRAAVAEWFTLRRDLAALTLASPPAGRLDDWRTAVAKLQSMEQEAAAKVGEKLALRPRSRWVKLEEVRAALPAKSVLIDIAKVAVPDPKSDTWLKSRYVAWVVAPAGRVRVVDLGEADGIEAAVTAFRSALDQAPALVAQVGEATAEAELDKVGKSLSEKLIKPLLAAAGDAEHWFVSPDAALWLVPLAALRIDESNYLVDRVRLTHLTSARDLVAPKPAAPGVGGLVLADPDFDRQTKRPSNEVLAFRPWDRLPETAGPVEQVGKLMGSLLGREPDIRLRGRADVGAFFAARKNRYVMFATHGFYLREDEIDAPPGVSPGRRASRSATNPLGRCGLVLSGANRPSVGDDGLLLGLEIATSDMAGTELVFLVACVTGTGDVRDGEGVAGLRQAFQLAGARAVVATLWEIPENQATPELTRRFWTRLAAGDSHAVALRDAQLAVIRDRRAKSKSAHPYFWAAFTLTGHASE